MSYPIVSIDNEPFEHETVSAAQSEAMDTALMSGGRVFPCMVFRQGDRWMISTSFEFAFVKRQVVPDSAVKGSNPRRATNRPLLTDHVRTIRDYLIKNKDSYIMPPVTLNVRELPALHVQRGNMATRSGFMVVTDSTTFYVTDGQHRIAAIGGHNAGRALTPGVLDEDPDFAKHGLAVLIVVEPDLARTHQDFADAAQTKQIPSSLLAAYNTREPINKVLTDIVDRAGLFKGRIDETSSTLPKMSQHVFLLNQVRGFLKELLVRDYAMADVQLNRHANSLLGTRKKQDEFVEEALLLLETLSAHMTPWRDIVDLPPSGGAANQIPEFRAQWVNMTATGLVIIGRAGYEIRKTDGDDYRRKKYIELATSVDWRREADIWKGTIITGDGDGKILTARAPVNLAAKAVLNAIDLDPTRGITTAPDAS